MKILWDFSFSQKGGALASLHDFIDFLNSNRNLGTHDHLLVTRISLSEGVLPDNAKLINVTKRNLFEKTKYLAFTLPEIAADREVDLIVFAGGLPWYSGNIPFFFFIRQALHFSSERKLMPTIQRVRLFLEKQILMQCAKKAESVFVQSDFMKETIRKDFGNGVAVDKIVWNVLNSEQYLRMKAASRCSGVKKRLLYVSLANGRPYKNHITLLKALKMILERNNNVELVITCVANPNRSDKVSTKIVDYVHSNGLQSNVVFAGDLSRNKTLMLYNQSDVFVFPSTCESFGVPLLEAMAAGLPIVASDIPVIREITKNCGLYFDPRDIDMIARQILDALRKSTELAEQSERTYLENYSERSIWEQTIGLIESRSR